MLTVYLFFVYFSAQSSEKKPKLSDSLLDFDDDLLNLEDEELELNQDQDHDELMREIDELLSWCGQGIRITVTWGEKRSKSKHF